MFNLLNNKKGITLIALIVTIIILLILAGISITMLTGDNGLLSKATDAVDTYKKSSIVEEIEIALAELEADYYERILCFKNYNRK